MPRTWITSAGAGAIISTPADLLQFIQALFTGKLVSQRSLDTMKTIRDGYGMGLFPYGGQQHPGFGHNGKTEGFGSSLQYYPKEKLAIAYCTNSEIYPKGDILEGILAICFHEPVQLPSFEAVAVPAELLQHYTGDYVDNNTGMKVTGTIEQNKLVLSVKGQPFPLVALPNRTFWNKAFGFFFEFSDDGKQLAIRDGDDTYQLHRSL